MKCKKRRNGMEPKFTNISHSKKLLRHISNTHKYPWHRCTSDIQFSQFIKQMLAKKSNTGRVGVPGTLEGERVGVSISRFPPLVFHTAGWWLLILRRDLKGLFRENGWWAAPAQGLKGPGDRSPVRAGGGDDEGSESSPPPRLLQGRCGRWPRPEPRAVPRS